MKSFWHRLFLDERPSISLSAFRVVVALTVGAVMLPTFVHLSDTYLSTAYKELNPSFFPVDFLKFVQKSPDTLVVAFVWIFSASWLFFLIGLFSQVSCIIMVGSCYYFYALNSFAMGTLSWDILFVTMFLMCITPYHGDYFSLDCLRRGDPDAYRRKRPVFLQRCLQVQLGFTYFYTALYKVTAEGNWLTDNPLYYVMNYPPPGVTKWFLLRDFLRGQPEICYWLGISIVVVEFLMVFLLFNPRTRTSGIYLGIFFPVLLLLTLDVPATFGFLFPAQTLLFINTHKILQRIEARRQQNASGRRPMLVYDGNCGFCRKSVNLLKVMDLFAVLEYKDFQQVSDLKVLHPDLDKEKVESQIQLVDIDGTLDSGFFVFRRLCFSLPMLYPWIIVFYFPGSGLIGPVLYRWVAKNRYLLHVSKTCKDNACYRHK